MDFTLLCAITFFAYPDSLLEYLPDCTDLALSGDLAFFNPPTFSIELDLTKVLSTLIKVDGMITLGLTEP
jgi:hypothetical protein